MTSLVDRLSLARHGLDRRSTARAVIGGVVLAWVVAAPVLAHADLVTADPTDGSVLAEAPTTITLTFSEALDAAKSSFTLIAANGTVGTGRASGDGTVMTLEPTVQDGRLLGPGRYEIRWTSVATDGDLLRGKLTFTVSEPTPAPATLPPTATASPATPASVAPASSEPASTAASTGQAASTGDIVLPIAVALLASVAGIGALVLRRSRRA